VSGGLSGIGIDQRLNSLVQKMNAMVVIGEVWDHQEQ
jgi:hypothetical protein